MPVLSQFTPIWGNEQFTPGWKDGGFRSWNAKGIQKIKDLYSDGVLLSFHFRDTKFEEALLQIFAVKKLCPQNTNR